MTDALVGEQTFEALSDPVVAEILGVPVDELLTGEWPVDGERAHRLEVAAGHKPDVTKYDYFPGRRRFSRPLQQSNATRGRSDVGSCHDAAGSGAARRGRGTLEGDLGVPC